MVIYGATLLGIKNGIVSKQMNVIEFESDIVDIFPEENKELISSILKEKQKEFTDVDSVIVLTINPTHLWIKQYKINNCTEIYNKSINLWKAVDEECEKQRLLRKGYNAVLDEVKYVRNTSERLNMLDTQEYLNFLDELNKLSIDLDRK